MPSDFDDLFEQLLEHKTVTVGSLNKETSETLRTSLSRRWNKYKERMSPLGFLRDELIGCNVRREILVEQQANGESVTIGVRFYLEKYVRRSYEILPTVKE